MAGEYQKYQWITLVPKKQTPETVGDYRSISLLNSVLKLLTKLLADRLQMLILQFVHQNKYIFLSKGQYKIVWLGHWNTYINVNKVKKKSFFSNLIIKMFFIQ